MRLFEYQGKELFERYAIPVPKRLLVERQSNLDDVATTIHYPCVVKAQVLTGGRGKAGLVKSVQSARDFAGTASKILDASPETRRLLCEEKVSYVRELYLSVSADPAAASAMIMASTEGGVEIETVAHETPERILRELVDITRGLHTYQCRGLAYDLGLEGPLTASFAALLGGLYTLFSECDAELVEINPLFITERNELVAGDAKIIIDDNASFRQKEFVATREHFDSRTAYEAAQDGIPYVQFDGDISLMCAGAGLTTTVFDLILDNGGTVSNYLEFGGPNYTKAVRAMELCLKNSPKVVLVVTFGTIARADVMAEGIAEAIEKLRPEVPIVTCIRGTNEEAAFETLRRAGLVPLEDTEEAVAKAVELSKGQNR